MFPRTAMMVFALASCVAAHAQHEGHHDMTVDRSGVVMNANSDRLPRGCDAVSGDYDFTIYAGAAYAADRPGFVFGMNDHEVRVPPCSRVTVRFVNEDEVRHQWMVHGLPKYLYPAGMFHIEAMGGHEQTGTFIVPPEDRTYLIHCDLAQHMEKGMRGQLVVGKGSGDLWAVTGISDAFYRFPYLPAAVAIPILVVTVCTFGITVAWQRRRKARNS
jgi:plastocyanin